MLAEVQVLALMTTIEAVAVAVDHLELVAMAEQDLREQEVKDMFQIFGLAQQIQSSELVADQPTLAEHWDQIQCQDLLILDTEGQQITLLANRLMEITVE
jgi:hypothetical protein